MNGDWRKAAYFWIVISIQILLLGVREIMGLFFGFLESLEFS
jgi:hypothetical protein